jgi:regulator of protease activity HflC (stomatin/prohibitin superfamily)
MNRISTIIKGVVVLLLLSFVVWEGFKWTAMRVFVGPDEALVVINKFGKALPADLVVAPAGSDDFKGVQEEVKGPGRYFLNPVERDWEVIPLVEIPAGDPHRWDWDENGNLKNIETAPKIGVISAKQGKIPPPGTEVVDPGFKGIQKQVLTPGTYKINKYLYEVKIEPAVVIPPGSVGVVTRLVGDIGQVSSATLTQIRASTAGPATQPTQAHDPAAPSRLVVGTTQRGILTDVLQPGIYYLNPRMMKVTIVPVGYDAITLEHPGRAIRFYSNDGYLVEADFTVVWGRAPGDAPNIVANIGNAQKVESNVIEPAMKAACQNEGAKYTAKELIQGTTRSRFQDDLSQSLEDQVKSRNIHVLLALIRNIAIKDTTGKDQTMGLLQTIQQANIEIEKDLTNKQKTETAVVKATLEQASKLVDVAKETVTSDTGVKVAGILADGTKKAAEIDAQRDLEVAKIELQIAQLDAQRQQILGKADADVNRLKAEAEAKGAKMLVDALGSPQAYNNYIFAKSFEPQELRLIFAGPGTFWTDLKNFQEVGASKMIQQGQPEKK